MSLNGSGVMQINSAGQPVVAATLIDATVFNALTTDLASAISMSIMKDGQQTVTADIPLAGHKLTGMSAGSARTDSASLATIQDGTGVYIATVGGTADVITLTPSPAIAAYVAGQRFQFLASGANTTNVTVAISGLAAKAITKNGTTALIAGDLPAAAMISITYDGTQFILGTTGAATVPAGASVLTPADNIFRIVGSGDATKKVAFEVDGLTTGTTRTATMPDRDLTLGPFIATEQATTSGTSFDFTSIPAGTRRITVNFVGVGTNGSSHQLIQIGGSGGIENTVYVSASSNIEGVNPNGIRSTAGFIIYRGTSAAVLSGSVTLSLERISTFTWCAAGVLNAGFGGTGGTSTTGGSKATSTQLDRVRITTVNGTDAFNAGVINISYE